MRRLRGRLGEGWAELDKDADGTYRRWLLRGNQSLPARRLAIVQVNPSVAGDAHVSGQREPTIDCVERWAEYETNPQFGEILYLNLFTWRAQQMANLAALLDQPGGFDKATQGREADQILSNGVSGADLVIAAWGDMVTLRRRHLPLVERHVADAITALHCDLYCVGEPLRNGQLEHSRRWNFGDRSLRLWRPRP